VATRYTPKTARKHALIVEVFIDSPCDHTDVATIEAVTGAWQTARFGAGTRARSGIARPPMICAWRSGGSSSSSTGIVKLSLLGADGGPKVGNERRIGDRIRPVQALATARTGSAWGGFVQSKLHVSLPCQGGERNRPRRCHGGERVPGRGSAWARYPHAATATGDSTVPRVKQRYSTSTRRRFRQRIAARRVFPSARFLA